MTGFSHGFNTKVTLTANKCIITQLQLDNMQCHILGWGRAVFRVWPGIIAHWKSNNYCLISIWNSGLKPIWQTWKKLPPIQEEGRVGTKGSMWQELSPSWPQWAENWIANEPRTAQCKNTMICVAQLWNCEREREFLLEAREWAVLVKKPWEDWLDASMWTWTT